VATKAQTKIKVKPKDKSRARGIHRTDGRKGEEWLGERLPGYRFSSDTWLVWLALVAAVLALALGCFIALVDTPAAFVGAQNAPHDWQHILARWPGTFTAEVMLVLTSLGCGWLLREDHTLVSILVFICTALTCIAMVPWMLARFVNQIR
jgi:hypothetical protein